MSAQVGSVEAAHEPTGHGNAHLGKAVLITTAVLWLLDWVSTSRLDAREALGIAAWVSAVLGALTVVARRLDTQRTPVWRQLLTLALTAGITSSLTHLAVLLLVTALPDAFADGPRQTFGATAVVGFFDGDALFGFWALLVELPRRIGAERRLEQERHALRQEAELARIRAALEPHFVLNTLNTIAGLVTEEPREARDLIATLGDLLRDAMPESRRHHHTVREEVSWLRGFARILESRHLGRLVFEWDVDRSAEDYVVPALLLQPLLENAVHHGALRRPGRGRVALRIAHDADRLRCIVEDDGPGFDPGSARPGGRGLDLVRRRITLESADASLRVDARPGRTRVEIVLPKRTQ
ncbi:sensor histidine kinase [Sorangium sp. So ce131]|uniref:sensor histidine kinase n=1 Tax=Sorangium sp. So ce131 TaxID=3133282 RepID=UPI003F5FB218